MLVNQYQIVLNQHKEYFENNLNGTLDLYTNDLLIIKRNTLSKGIAKYIEAAW